MAVSRVLEMSINEAVHHMKSRRHEYFSRRGNGAGFGVSLLIFLSYLWSLRTGVFSDFTLHFFPIRVIPVTMLGGSALYFLAHLRQESQLEHYARRLLSGALRSCIWMMMGLTTFLVLVLIEKIVRPWAM